jgi:hypothetical protein
MADPRMRYEGNLRLASTHSDGYPHNLEDMFDLVLDDIADQSVNPYGPIVLFFNLPPDDQGPANWPCQIGTAITGLGRASESVYIEDYRSLHALVLNHMPAIKNISQTYKRLRDHALAMGFRVRPYWRIALRRQRLADGNLFPPCEVSVFLDR